MQWVDRQGNPVPGEPGQDRLIETMYGNPLGRVAVKVLIRPGVSKAVGWLMDSRLSRVAIRRFITAANIDMTQFEDRPYRSFNDFFTRQIRPELRPVDPEPAALISPCDCKLTVYPITEDLQVEVKGRCYTMETLLRNEDLAARFQGGTFLLLRLTKDDYHRYCYIDNGIKSENVRIPGVLHTVNPAALERYPVYRENTREYSLLESENFGTVLMMEVGATLVGRIVNHHGAQSVSRGQEKGMFEFGGSTIILCLQKDQAVIDGDLLENTKKGLETVVHMGQRIGTACRTPRA